jgi:hypothetical protein
MRARYRAVRVLAAILVSALGACQDISTPTDPPLDDPNAFVVNGTIRYLDIEGGCWAFQVDPRTAGYQPVGLPPEFRRDGLAVRAALKPRGDLVSFCMIGPIAEVVWIRAR